MLEVYAREFVNICAFIIKYRPQQMSGGYIYIDPAQLRKKLDKYKYEESDTKIRIWRNLRWLHSDQGHMTKNIRIEGKQQRMAVLDLEVYRQLKQLLPVRKNKDTTTKNE